MSRDISLKGLQGMLAEESGEAWLPLLTIEHDDLDQPIRVCANTVDVIFKGQTFVGFPFKLDLPADTEDKVPEVQLEIDNVDRKVVEALRTITSPPTCTLELVRQDSATYATYTGEVRLAADWETGTHSDTHVDTANDRLELVDIPNRALDPNHDNDWWNPTAPEDNEPEHVTNGTFDADLTGWTAHNQATLTWDNGRMRVDSDAGGYDDGRQEIGTEAEIRYTASVDYEFPAGTVGKLYLVDEGGELAFEDNLSGTGTATIDFVARYSKTIFACYVDTASSHGWFDNASLKKRPFQNDFDPVSGALRIRNFYGARTTSETTTTDGGTTPQDDTLVWGQVFKSPGETTSVDPDTVWGTAVYDRGTPTEPAKGSCYLDPDFNRSVCRVTDVSSDGSGTSRMRNFYSRKQAYNCDNTYVMLHDGDQNFLYDASTYAYIREITAMPQLDSATVDYFWHPTNPAKLYYWDHLLFCECDVDSNTSVVLKDFGTESWLWTGAYAIHTRMEGSPSKDGRYWTLMVQDSTQNSNPANPSYEYLGVFIWDRETDTVLDTMDSQTDANGNPYQLDWVSTSPDGQYAVLRFNNVPADETRVYPMQSAGFGTLTSTLPAGHADLGMDADGNPVMVHIDFSGAYTNSANISLWDLATGGRTQLLDFGAWSLAAHISCQAFDLPGWALVSVYDGVDGAWFDHQVFALSMHPGRFTGDVARIANTHNDYYNYNTEPQASANRDFTRVVWKANWFEANDSTDVYEVQLPSNALQGSNTTTAQPARGTCVDETDWNTKICRITDTANEAHLTSRTKTYYSARDAYNADGTLLLVSDSQGYYLYEADTYAYVRTLTELAVDQTNEDDAEPIWHPTETNRLYFFRGTQLRLCDVDADTSSVVADFANRLPWTDMAKVWTRFQGSPSRDGRYWCLFAQTSGQLGSYNMEGAFTYDVQNDAILSTLDLLGAEMRMATVTPSGTYALLAYNNSGDTRIVKLPVGDLTATATVVCDHWGFKDVARNPAGDDVLVRFNYDDSLETDSNGNNTHGWLVLHDLVNDTSTRLLNLWSDGITSRRCHPSGRGIDKPGWAICSTYGADNDHWSDNKVFGVELVTTDIEVLNIAHTRVVHSDYWTEPHATCNGDITRVAYKTNWHSSSNEMDVYQVPLPDNAFGPVESTTESTSTVSQNVGYQGTGFYYPIEADVNYTLQAKVRTDLNPLDDQFRVSIYDVDENLLQRGFAPTIVSDRDWRGHASDSFTDASITFMLDSTKLPAGAVNFMPELRGKGNVESPILLKHIKLADHGEPSTFNSYNDHSYETPGVRTGPAIDVSAAAEYMGSFITWDATLNGGSVTVEVSHDDGITWHVCSNGDEIPGFTQNQDLSGHTIRLRQTLSTEEPTKTPWLDQIDFKINDLEFVLEVGPMHFRLNSASYDALTVSAGLGYEADYLSETATKERINPTLAPGLFQ